MICYVCALFRRVWRVAGGAGVMEREVLELIKQYTKFAQVRTFETKMNKNHLVGFEFLTRCP
jgi:signal recognition particle GTPase